MSKFEIVKKILTDNEQEHLLRFYEELNEEQQEAFVQQLAGIDFKYMKELYQNAMDSYSTSGELLDDRMRPLPEEQSFTEFNNSTKYLEETAEFGYEAIAKGQVGVILMAGGQGTRLGVNYPKGMYSVDLISQKTLFQIQAERIRKVQEIANNKYKLNGKVTWYIMTSGPTNEQTESYLEENHYFGLNKEDVVLFKQGLLPCFDLKGKLILDGKSNIAMAPDGNGGIYKSLKDNKILDDFKARGIQYLHAHSVDNILIKVADPTFIGFCISKKADCAAKVVDKSSPTEAVGVICFVDDKVQVVEYSEITTATASLTNNGELVFSAGNICNHFFTAEFLDRVADADMKLHVAKKKIPYINEGGTYIKPTTTNGIKIEKFVFDVFQFSENFYSYKVLRENDFSPVKNANDAGKDCPLTARRDLYNLHKRYLESQNATVIGDEVEISPLVSYSGEGLQHFTGKVINSPQHIS